MRTADDPSATLMAVLRSTYGAAADLAKRDRHALDCAIQVPRVPRPVEAGETKGDAGEGEA